MQITWLPAADRAARDRGLVPGDLEGGIRAAWEAGHTYATRPARGRRRLVATAPDGRKVELEYVALPHGKPAERLYIQDVAVEVEEV
jgi:hypothetical protein